MRNRLAILVPCVAALLIGCGGGGGGDAAPNNATPGDATTAEPADARVEAAFAAVEAAGMPVIVAIQRADGAVHVRDFGALADDGIAPDDTQVDLGSITKTVTGVVVMTMVEDGVLALDDRLGDLFAGVPPDKAGITVHQLLTHSAGFVDSLGNDEEVLGRDAYLARAWSAPLGSPPGTAYAYSNVGYSVLAAVVEERTGRSFEAVLADDVLEPAGLTGIGYDSTFDAERSLRTEDGRTVRAASWGDHPPSWHLVGNGGLVATAPAFLALRAAVADGTVLSAGARRTLEQPHVLEGPDAESSYGYGLVVEDRPGIGPLLWHDGGNDIYSAEWAEHQETGDRVLTAGLDTDAGDAFAAMALVQEALWGAATR